MTASIAQRFKHVRQDLDDYGGSDQKQALKVITDLARHVPLIGAMTTRSFDEVLDQLRAGRVLEPGDEEKRGVVERGLSKQAPFHRSRNSVADAVLIELYETAVRGVDLNQEPHAFITSNSDDFSLPDGDARQPHRDLASLFAVEGSTYGLGVDGLNQVLLDYFGEEIEELFAETYFEEEPRRLDEIVEAEPGAVRSDLAPPLSPARAPARERWGRRRAGAPTRSCRARAPACREAVHRPWSARPVLGLRAGDAQRQAFRPALGPRQRMGLPRHMTTSRAAQPTATSRRKIRLHLAVQRAIGRRVRTLGRSRSCLIRALSTGQSRWSAVNRGQDG